MSTKILIINPGSTSTKIGVYEDETEVMEETLRHTTEEIAQYDTIYSQKDFRREVILDVLKEKGIDLADIDVVVGRGGMLKPIPGGTYATTPELLEDLKIGFSGQHASNLGGILAHEIASEIDVPSYIVDPVVVDELQDVARLSGHPLIERVSIFHALNQKAVAKKYAKEVGKAYEDLNLIVVHMGGGVSVGAHKNGRIIDVANALDGDGPFSPERSGGLPSGALMRLCFSGDYTQEEVTKMISGNGGFNAYVGTNDMRELVEMSKDDPKAAMVKDAFHYQLGKEIGSAAVVLDGKVDQIILTGGIAYNQVTQDYFKEHCSFIAPITVYPGEDELLALAQGALRVINGEEEAKIY